MLADNQHVKQRLKIFKNFKRFTTCNINCIKEEMEYSRYIKKVWFFSIL